MKIYLKGRNNSYNASATWDDQFVTVKKGSVVNNKIQEGYKFVSSVLNARNDRAIVSRDGFYKTPQRNCSSNKAFDEIDVSTMRDDYIPRTNYIIATVIQI